MTDKQKAIRLGAVALVVLFGGCLIALLSPRLQVAVVMASFVGYTACTRRALTLCRADDLVFEPRNSRASENAAREALRAGFAADSAGALSLARTMNATPRVASSESARRPQSAYPRPVEGTR